MCCLRREGRTRRRDAGSPVAGRRCAGDVQSGIDQANAKLARVEKIKKFAILPTPWMPGGDELTPTMKLKRKVIAEKYASEIDALYT